MKDLDPRWVHIGEQGGEIIARHGRRYRNRGEHHFDHERFPYQDLTRKGRSGPWVGPAITSNASTELSRRSLCLR